MGGEKWDLKVIVFLLKPDKMIPNFNFHQSTQSRYQDHQKDNNIYPEMFLYWLVHQRVSLIAAEQPRVIQSHRIIVLNQGT
jgi:hypothetical protein